MVTTGVDESWSTFTLTVQMRYSVRVAATTCALLRDYLLLLRGGIRTRFVGQIMGADIGKGFRRRCCEATYAYRCHLLTSNMKASQYRGHST